jgi:pantoate--beta-alanine ligase
METFSTVVSLRRHLHAERMRGRSIAFVPTMGALHEGHRSCIDIARGLGDILVVSIFLNPTQFGPGEDLDNYPSTLDEDLELCARCGCDVVFTPNRAEIYPEEQFTWVDVEGLTGPLCGRTRKGHFRGVATVVAKLFNIVGPDVAVFGQKDAQQALVIRAMIEQLNLPVDIRLSPIVREADGLACSSRNRHLSADERRRAAGIHAALEAGVESLRAGARDPAAVCAAVRGRLAHGGINAVEYVELLDVKGLKPIAEIVGRVILAVAARIGTTRLIDNRVVEVGSRVEEVPLF